MIIHPRINNLESIKIMPISKELFSSLEKWRNVINDKSYILKSINSYGHFINNLHLAYKNTTCRIQEKI